MAAAEAIFPSSLQDDLTCRMCNDIFVDATLLPNCWHTFCRSCLKRHNQSNVRQHVYISCNVCETINDFTLAKGVDDLPANKTVNKIVDNYIQEHGCKTAPRPNCTACRRQEDAVSFCKTCERYLCEKCQKGHREMCDYEDHETVPFEDIVLKEQSGLGNTSSPSAKHLKELPAKMSAMSNYSSDKSVAIGYGGENDGVSVIDSSGRMVTNCRHKIPPGTRCDNIIFLHFQGVDSFCFSNAQGVHIYSYTGDKIKTVNVPSFFRTVETMSKDSLGGIIITPFMPLGKKVYIYDSTLTTLQHSFETRHITHQAYAARQSGKIVTSSSTFRLSEVTVYDRNGSPGVPLPAPEGVYLYAAVDVVDEQDMVYVASVNRWSGKVVIRLYKIDGLNLEETNGFNEIYFRCTWSDRCSLVSLPKAEMLAFASGNDLYSIKVPRQSRDISLQMSNMTISS